MSNKSNALDFLQMIVAGDIDAAYAKHVAAGFVHHNMYFPAGADALREAMKNAHIAQPGKIFEVKQAIAEGDRVAVHSRFALQPEGRDYAVMHIFRFRDGKIVEMWDFGQQAPADSPNADGFF
jgi:predicted SnoaL-like aldol condensation-catalyzing enzyme